MATLTAKITLTSTDLTTDSLSAETSNSLTVTEGGIIRKSITGTGSGSAQTIATAAEYAVGSYIYVKNTDTTATDYLIIRSSSADHIQLAGGEWAWFPWVTDADITVYASTGGTVLEYGIFS